MPRCSPFWDLLCFWERFLRARSSCPALPGSVWQQNWSIPMPCFVRKANNWSIFTLNCFYLLYFCHSNSSPFLLHDFSLCWCSSASKADPGAACLPHFFGFVHFIAVLKETGVFIGFLKSKGHPGMAKEIISHGSSSTCCPPLSHCNTLCEEHGKRGCTSQRG